jgi:hypothetical protein
LDTPRWTRREFRRHAIQLFGDRRKLGRSAISNAYYIDNRTAAVKLSFQIGIDTADDIVNEFCPDLERKLRRRTK